MNRFVGQGSIAARQASHGFSVGTPVKSSSGAWAAAQADAAANLAHGIVTSVNGDRFVVTAAGFVAAPSHGLGAAGTERWTSQGSAGATVSTQPSSGWVQYLLRVHDPDTLIVRVAGGELL